MRAILFLSAACGCLVLTSAAEPPNTPAVDYKRDVVPILEAKCLRCHSPKKRDGKLDLSSRASMLKGGVSGPALEPGKPDKSILIELIHFNEMPPKREKLRVTADELKKLKTWVEAGAPEK